MKLTLKELISDLKAELSQAQDDADAPMFVLDEAIIKTRVIAVDRSRQGLGVKFFVASGSLDFAQEDTSEHEVTIKLKPITEENKNGIKLGAIR